MKTKKTYFFIYLLLLPSIFFTTCKKNKEAPVTIDRQFRFSANALEYVKLPEKKYLIYKDSASGESDSVVVTNCKLYNQFSPYSITFYGTIPAHQYDVFAITLTNKSFEPATEWFMGQATATNDILPNENVPSSDSCLLRLHHPPDNYLTSFAYTNYANPEFLIPSINIEGKEYVDVLRFVESNGLEENNPAFYQHTYYWAKRTGIIKRTVRNGADIKTHTLLRHNLY